MSETRKPGPAGQAAQGVQDAANAARQVGEKAGELGAGARDAAGDIAREARSRGKDMLGDVKEEAFGRAESGKQGIADRLEDMAQAVHRSGEQLEGHQDMLAHLVERGAAELGTLADTLRGNDLQSLLRDLGGLARRQPALFLGASIAAGFAMTRVGRVALSGAAGAADTQRGAAASREAGDERS